ncbi:IS256 family transposase [Membranicola marinus]|uniref:Mutator family transposase n=1 Tax=Membranihabitans marinus TaxID=1227546 RepID=A0A953I316_9BACT|nr:IS256 family transposase [Membranihabitans marinus]MBY5960302.1 IS256 family transposase [Membranihabitans marinus]
MKDQTQKLLDELVNQIADKDELAKVQDELFKRGVETLLKSELTAHLGHTPYEKTEQPKSNTRNGHSSKTLKTKSGEVLIQVPRDRAGTFDPVTVEKHSKMSNELEQTISLLYAKGMSTEDITDFVEQTYGVKYSKGAISVITNSLLKDIADWQSRPLEDQYAVIWIDAIHYKIREDGRVLSKAILVVMGISMEGVQDVLSLKVYETESASVWMEMLSDLKSRGVEDILFMCSDNLKGLDKAVQAVYPQSIHQICIVHQIRNTLKFVSYKERKAIIADIKSIYKADNVEMAQEALERFRNKWQHKYHLAVKSWEHNWDNLTAFLNYPQEIRTLIYTTNIIESFNASLRKYTKNKKVFPNDQAALKSVFLAAMQIKNKWQKKRRGWTQIFNQLTILFPDRVKVIK